MITVLCATRGRPDKALKMFESFERTQFGDTQGARLVFGVDADDPKLQDYLQTFAGKADVTILRPPDSGSYIHGNNALARIWRPKSSILGIVADDNRFRTRDWDVRVYQSLETPGVAFGNDGFWAPGTMTTHAFISAEIFDVTGWLMLPSLKHMYADNVGMDLGKATRLVHMPDVMVEHLHPAARKAQWDEGYERTAPHLKADRIEYERWKRSDYQALADKLRRARWLSQHSTQ